MNESLTEDENNCRLPDCGEPAIEGWRLCAKHAREAEDRMMPKVGTLDDLEKILQREDDVAIEILPNGQIRTKPGEPNAAKVLTMRENLGGEY